VPQACTLPTAEQPLRVAAFDELFTDALTGLKEIGPAGIRMRLRPETSVAARAAGLAVRETACCSFFTFALTTTGGDLTLDVTVRDEHAGVLRALAVRARSHLAGSRA
jgi:hypothetical protein